MRLGQGRDLIVPTTTKGPKMNHTATHQATYTKNGEEGVRYFVGEDALIAGLDTWFGITADDDQGSYRYMNSLRVTWGEVTELVFVCRCGGVCNLPVKKNGGFRPGHDAKLVSRLLDEVRTGQRTAEDAADQLADRPNLAAKLARMLNK